MWKLEIDKAKRCNGQNKVHLRFTETNKNRSRVQEPTERRCEAD